MSPNAFLTFTNLLQDLLLLVSGDGVILAANRAACRRLGLSSSTVNGTRLADIVTTPLPQLNAYLNLCSRSAQPLPGALTFKMENEESLPCRCEGAMVSPRGSDAAVLQLRLIPRVEIQSPFLALNQRIDMLTREVAMRQKTEKALEEQLRFRSLGADIGLALTQHESLECMLQACCEAVVEHLDAAFARIWTVNPAGDMLHLQASAGLYTHLDGAHARVPVGKYKIGLIASERKPHITNTVQEDARISDPDWARRESMTAFVGFPLIINGRLGGVLAMFARHKISDAAAETLGSVVTEIALGIERRQAIFALQESEARKGAMLESSMDAIITMDATGHVVEWNPAAEEMFGFSKHQIVGAELANFVIPLAYRERHRNALAHYAETRQGSFIGSRIEITALRADGSEFSVELAVSAIPLQEPPLYMGYVRDITARKEADAALKRQAQELARSNAELERFAYVASHDLQEPLRMVTSYTQLLSRRYKDHLDADAEEFISYVVDGAIRMQALINDLLVYSRVGSAGKAFGPVNLTEVLESVCSNLRIAIQESSATITHSELPTIFGDASQMVQLLQNLVGNALKFRTDQPAEVHIEAKQQGAEWLLSVQDNGIGIDERFFERIFLIFQRLHSRSEYQGTGIGLAICKKIVERHGGQIKLESAPGNGTTFYFTLPVWEDPAS